MQRWQATLLRIVFCMLLCAAKSVSNAARVSRSAIAWVVRAVKLCALFFTG